MPVNKNKAAKKRIIGSFGAKAAVAGLLAAVLGFGIMMGDQARKRRPVRS